MTALPVLRGLSASLSALLRATAPSGPLLTGVDGLEHARKVALLALADGFAWVRNHGHASPPQDTLAAGMKAVEGLLNASEHGAKPTVTLVHARVVGWDALSVISDEVRQLKGAEQRVAVVVAP